MSKSAVIVGAGLGGLLCGRILTRAGWQVTILEQWIQAGGALQTFVRGGIRFDTGFHSVGGLGPGEPLEQIFRPLGLMGLPWKQVEPDALDPGTLPFLRLNTACQEEMDHIVATFRQSTWRLEGGGKTLVDALSEGQEILFRKKVLSIENQVVTCEDGSSYTADAIICDIHPQVVFTLVKDHVRPSYLKRLARMQNGPGVYTVNCKLLPGVIRWKGQSTFLKEGVMIHFGEADENGFARSLDLMAFEGNELLGSPEAMIQTAERALPGLRAAVEQFWCSSPATWERFTGTPGGSAFGLQKHEPMDYLPVGTPLPWLWLTGQNVGLHGILGTSVTAINTCNSILS